jgi:hypothetical protein
MTTLDNMRVGGPESELRRDAPQSPGVYRSSKGAGKDNADFRGDAFRIAVLG